MKNNMLRIKRRDIIVDKSELLYEADFSNPKQLEDFEITGGNWVVENGWLTAEKKDDGGGLIYSHKHYLGDVLIEFEGRTVLPYDNDLNYTICAKGWDYKNNDADISYIGGLQGWWLGKTGIERAPEYNVSALTSLHNFTAGQTYLIQAGKVGNTIFMFIDGVLAVEIIDANPIVDFGRVGLGVYASKAQFRNFKVYKPYVRDFDVSYADLRKENK